MAHAATILEQRKFYEENIDQLLTKYSDGYIVYYSGPHDKYEYFKTKGKLEKAHPSSFDGVMRFCTNPLVIDIIAEQFQRKNKKPEESNIEKMLKSQTLKI